MTDAEMEKIIKNYSPMSEAGFLILASILQGNYGYGIMESIRKTTGNRVRLGPGTVYTVLGKMHHDGILEIVEQNKRKKIYRVTEFGMQILKTELFRLKQMGIIASQVVEKL